MIETWSFEHISRIDFSDTAAGKCVAFTLPMVGVEKVEFVLISKRFEKVVFLTLALSQT